MDAMLRVGAAAIVRRSGQGWQLLTARRTEPPIAAGLWEFPGGKVDPGETVERCVVREIREELGVDVALVQHIVGPLDGWWPLTERIAISLWLCTIPEHQEPELLEDHDALSWLTADELYSVPWIPADEVIVRQLETMLRAADAEGTFPVFMAQ